MRIQSFVINWVYGFGHLFLNTNTLTLTFTHSYKRRKAIERVKERQGDEGERVWRNKYKAIGVNTEQSMPTVWHISINAIKTASFFLVLTIANVPVERARALAFIVCVGKRTHKEIVWHLPNMKSDWLVPRRIALLTPNSWFKYRLLCLSYMYASISIVFIHFRILFGLFTMNWSNWKNTRLLATLKMNTNVENSTV